MNLAFSFQQQCLRQAVLQAAPATLTPSGTDSIHPSSPKRARPTPQLQLPLLSQFLSSEKGQVAGKVTVMEVLKVRWGNLLGISSSIAQNAFYGINAQLSTKPPGPTGPSLVPFPNISDPTIFDYSNVNSAIGMNNPAPPNLVQAYRYV